MLTICGQHGRQNSSVSCIPTVNLSAKQNVPWLHKGLTKAMRARNLAFRCMKRTRRSVHLLDYKRKRNKVANMIKKARSNYLKKLNPSNPNTFWKATKYLTKKSSTIPTLLDCDGNAVQEDKEKATLLNDFFPSVLITHILPYLPRTTIILSIPFLTSVQVST